MRSKFLIFFLFFGNFSYCQPDIAKELITFTPKITIRYDFYSGYENDSTYESKREVRVFISDNIYISDMEIAGIDKKINDDLSKQFTEPTYKNEFIDKLKNDKVLRNSLRNIIVKSQSHNFFYIYHYANNMDVLVVDSSRFMWKTESEKKVIDSFMCEKKTGIQSGKLITAFITSYPINISPSIITGLNGLLVEYLNPYKKIRYRIRNIQTFSGNNPYKEFYKYKIIDKATYDVLLKEEQEKANNFVQ